MKRLFLAAGLLAMVSGVALADQVIEKPVNADTPEKFAEVAAGVRKDMSSAGRYEFIRPDQKGRVEADLDTMMQLLQQSGSVAAMQNDKKIQLFNTQENLNGILSHSDKNRLVCDNKSALGTLIRSNTCRTLGDIERDRASSKQMLDAREEKGVIPLVNKAAGPKN